VSSEPDLPRGETCCERAPPGAARSGGAAPHARQRAPATARIAQSGATAARRCGRSRAGAQRGIGARPARGSSLPPARASMRRVARSLRVGSGSAIDDDAARARRARASGRDPRAAPRSCGTRVHATTRSNGASGRAQAVVRPYLSAVHPIQLYSLPGGSGSGAGGPGMMPKPRSRLSACVIWST
jgi:hypothetical protein